MDNVNLIIYIAIAVCGLFGALMGIRKGLYKALVNLVVVLATAGISLAISKLALKLSVSEDELLLGFDKLATMFPDSAFMVEIKETVVALSERGNAVEMAAALPMVIISPLVFMITYLVLGLIIKIPEAIVCRSIFGRRGGNRLGGAIVSSVTKIISFGIFIIPLVGYITMANTVLDDIGNVKTTEQSEVVQSMADEEIDEDVEQEQTQSLGATLGSISASCVQINDAYITPIKENFIVKTVYVCGGRWIFNALTTAKVDDVEITLQNEIKVLTDIYGELPALLDAPIAEYGDAQTVAIDNITTTLDNAVVVPTIISSVISYASDAWLNGEDVMGYEKLNVGEYYEPTFDKILTVFSQTTNDTISQDIHTAGNIMNICIEQGFFKETFGGGNPMTVLQREEFMGSIFAELYLNDTTRPFVADLVNAFKNYIYRVYNEVNGTAVPFPDQLVMETVTEQMMYDEGARISSIMKNFVSFYESFDPNATDNLQIIINTDLRSLGRAFDTLKQSLFVGDAYEFVLQAVLRSEGASQIAILTPEFVEAMLSSSSSMETVLVSRQQLAIIASVSSAEDREKAIEHLLKNIDSDSASVIIETLTPEVMRNLGMSKDESKAMSGALGSIVQEIANNDGEFTEEQLSGEIEAVDKIVSTVQAATDGDKSSNLFSNGEDDSSRSGLTADELVDTVVNSTIVSSAINSSSKDEEGNTVENSYGISDKLTEADKDSAKTAIEQYYQNNATEGDDAELKETLDSLASIFGVQVELTK